MSVRKFNCAIISSNPDAAERCSKELKRLGSIGAIDCLSDYPSDDILTRMFRLNAIELLLIDCTDLPRAIEIIGSVRGQNPNVEILAICQEDVKILSALMRAGVQDYIPASAALGAFRDALCSSIEKLRGINPGRAARAAKLPLFFPASPAAERRQSPLTPPSSPLNIPRNASFLSTWTAMPRYRHS